MELKTITPEDWGKIEDSSERKHYPSVNFKMKDISEAKKWDVGKTYRLEIEVELTSISERRGKSDVGFDIKKVGVITKDSKKEFIEMAKGGK